MIAEVVVDIKNKAVNKVFDYLVPEEFIPVIQPGVRVLVPFGPRTIMGFVISLKESTQLQKLRPIKELIDVVPVLNDELRELGMSLTTAFNIFLRQSVREKGIPFDITLNVPNSTTIQAIEEGDKLASKSSTNKFKNTRDLLNSLDEE